MKKMNKKGFTLIEMLVVIAIIAILVAIVIPTVTNATEKARQATDVANIRSLVAEYEIATLGTKEEKTAAFAKFAQGTIKLASTKAKYTAPTEANMVVTYESTVLTDGNGSAKNIYTWNLKDILSDTTDKVTP